MKIASIARKGFSLYNCINLRTISDTSSTIISVTLLTRKSFTELAYGTWIPYIKGLFDRLALKNLSNTAKYSKLQKMKKHSFISYTTRDKNL